MNQAKRLVLGLDSSTQSLSAVVLDIEQHKPVLEHSLSYRNDARLYGYGFDHSEMIVPPREAGEADQPPLLFLASLDALFSDLGPLLAQQGFSLSDIGAINTSGQQHGHVYLNQRAQASFAALRNTDPSDPTLVERLADVFAYGTAPIWKTANTAIDAAAIRRSVGGKQRMITLSGSDSPLRFTGAVIRRVGRQFPESYAATWRTLLISSLIPALLCGDATIGVDFGNAAGMSLMNYRSRLWDKKLLKAVSTGLPGGAQTLAAKLGPIVHPLDRVGSAAAYFVRRYGLAPDCAIIAGSGDNPQSKVLISGDLLSLGTSFVLMSSTSPGTIDPHGWANAMYDGLGRPFCFGCRSNGALVWERVRSLHHLAANDFQSSSLALQKVAPGTVLRWWQPDSESFPLSAAGPLTRLDQAPPDFNHDFAAIVDSTLGLLYAYSRGFASAKPDRLYITGGPSANPDIVRRIAAIWNCPVSVIGGAGAALGTAVAAAIALSPEDLRSTLLTGLVQGCLGQSPVLTPEPEMVAAYHGTPDKPGYLHQLQKAFAGQLIE